MSTRYYVVHRATHEKAIQEINNMRRLVIEVNSLVKQYYTDNKISEGTQDEIFYYTNNWCYFVDGSAGMWDFLSTHAKYYTLLPWNGYGFDDWSKLHSVEDVLKFVENHAEEYFIMDEYDKVFEPDDIREIVKARLGHP